MVRSLEKLLASNEEVDYYGTKFIFVSFDEALTLAKTRAEIVTSSLERGGFIRGIQTYKIGEKTFMWLEGFFDVRAPYPVWNIPDTV